MAEQSNQRTRREAVQRVQAGLIGLCTVLLVVAFANIVATTIRPDSSQALAASDGQPVTTASNATAFQPDSEPFADLGVTPKSDGSAAGAQQAPVGPSVPDLEPDPRLSQPMDHDPKKTGTAGQRP